MYGAFADALTAFDQNADVGAIMSSGEGSDFCAGNDLGDFLSGEPIDRDMLADPERSEPARAVHALVDMRKPVLAAVEGRAIGFGATMLLHADYVAMSDAGFLLYPFLDIGILPEAGSSVLLARQVGQRKAAELLLDAGPIPAASAVSLGLASTALPVG